MPFLTRPHFEDRQIVQYGEDVINLSGQTRIAPTILDFSGATTGETAVTINGLTGYLNGERLSGLVVEPAQLRISGSTGTTTQNVTGFVLQSIDPYGSVEWGPISGVSWSVSACTSPLYVSTIEACPNPTDPIYITAGNVQFGAAPSLIADITNTRLGIGTGSPSKALDIQNGDLWVENSDGKFETQLTNVAGPLVRLTGDSTSLTRIAISSPPDGGISIGHRGLTEAGFPGYGKQGDGFLYSSEDENGLNIISQPGTGTDDYIRFYAGDDANGTTPSLYIQGSGSTKGNVGINTETPEEKLHIESGDLLVNNTSGRFYTDIENSSGPVVKMSGASSDLTRYEVNLGGPGSIAMGIRGLTEAGFPGYGKQNDSFLYSSNENNGLNILSTPGTGTDDYIRFYAGQDANGTTPDLYIDGDTVRGNIGINTDSPTEKLHVEGSVRIVDGTEQTGYVLTCDATGTASWQFNSTGFSGNTSGTCITDLYITNLYGCSPITVHDTVVYNGSIIDSATTNSFIFGTNHVLTATSLTHGVSADANSILGGSNNRILPFQIGTYNTIIGGSNNTLGVSRLQSSGIISSNSSTIEGSNGPNVILGGTNNIINGSNGNVILGGINNTTKNGVTAGGILGGQNNTLTTAVFHSNIIGGQNITGSTNDTVYVPNLTVRNDHILHSDSILEVSDLPGSLESEMKGSFTEFNWNGVTANVNSNNNPSGFTSVIAGNLSPYPTLETFGFISYFNSGHTRTGTPVVGNDFNRNKLFIKTAEDSDGMVINPQAGNPSATLWFEMDSRSVMKLKGDGVSKANLGIAMSSDGTEDATANLQIGGTGTTGTFKYRDGNQQSGYVLTSDSDGNASWGPAGAFTGNTSATCISDLYVSNIHSCSPLHINPLDEGNLYFGSTSAITFNVSNGDIELNSTNNRIIGGNDGTGPFLSLSDTSNYVYTATAGGQKPNLYMEEGYGVDLYYYNPGGGNYKTYLALNDNIDLRLNNSTGTTPTVNIKNITALPSDRGLIYIGLNGEGGTNVNGLTLGTNYTNDVTSDTYTGLAAILGSRNSTVSRSVENSVIVGGNVNKIETGVTRSVIVAGSSNNIDGNDSVIAGGSTNTNDGDNSAIIGGSNNSILTGVQRSVVIGGQNIIGTKNDTVYVPSLGTAAGGGATFNGPVQVTGGNLTINREILLNGIVNSTGTVSSPGPTITGTTLWRIGLTGANTSALPDGNSGQRLTAYIVSGGGGGNSMTITPATLNGYSTITLTNTGESVDLLYDPSGAGWTVIGGNGYILA